MTQDKRDFVSIDINSDRPKVEAPSGKERITKTTWDPVAGAEEACRRVEEQIKLQHQLEQARTGSGTEARVIAVELEVRLLKQSIERIAQILEAKK